MDRRRQPFAFTLTVKIIIVVVSYIDDPNKHGPRKKIDSQLCGWLKVDVIEKCGIVLCSRIEENYFDYKHPYEIFR